MDDAFIETLRSWHAFYDVLAGVSAALIGMTLVALTLGVDLKAETTREGIRAFAAPNTFYFASILIVSLIMLIPTITPSAFALLIFLKTTVGLLWVVRYVWLIIRWEERRRDFNLIDWLAQIVGIVLAYLLMLAAPIAILADQWSIAFPIIWFAVLLLLTCAITNAWTIVIWIIDQRQR